jgi:hypothetical protein
MPDREWLKGCSEWRVGEMEGHREVNLGEKIRDGSPRVCKAATFPPVGCHVSFVVLATQ